MAQVILGGNTVNTYGELPEIGEKAPHFELLKSDLSVGRLKDFEGKRLILNIFPSIDTNTCATSVRTFNERAKKLKNTEVLCISRDLPFAQSRFCASEGLDDVIMLSDFKTGAFGKELGVAIEDGAFEGLLARAIVVVDKDHTIVYTELVPEIGQEPDYKAALNHLM
ncbi:thiol peroxidase [Croceibacter atlanticus]|uniref:thiol peroxidase n=1 Tax=Croceibacter atlanticus TaxID=313588 RepID=UPI0032B1873E